MNFHNQYVWADVKLQGIQERGHHRRLSSNVWAGVLGDVIIGPYMLPQMLTGLHYLHFLINVLHTLLEAVPLQQRIQMCFMHDDAPALSSPCLKTSYIDMSRPLDWLGGGGRRDGNTLPARFPNISPLDFWLWGHLQELIYTTPINDVQTLQDHVFSACQQVQQQLGVLQRVHHSSCQRAEGCIVMNKHHGVHLL